MPARCALPIVGADPLNEHGVRPPAVVILGELNGLGVCRSLARGDVISHVVDSSRFAPAMLSRHAIPVLSPHLEGEALIDRLLTLHGSLGGAPMLFNTHEMAVLTLSQYRDRLHDSFTIRMPPHGTLATLQDKRGFNDLAVALRLPVPDGVVLRFHADIASINALRFPIVVKPTDKRFVHERNARSVVICHNRRDATAVCGTLIDQGIEVLVQVFIDGDADQIYFCLFYCGRNDEIVAMFTGRKLASTAAGTTAYCQAAPEAAPELEKLTRSFIERTGCSGMGGVEYKWDKSTDRFLIVEPTVGRTDMQAEIATLCGVNIPLLAYLHELGEPPIEPSATVPQDVVWRSSLLEPLKGVSVKLPRGTKVYDGYWRGDDPIPGSARYTVGLASSVLRRLAGCRGH